jgi:hypothetical protein
MHLAIVQRETTTCLIYLFLQQREYLIVTYGVMLKMPTRENNKDSFFSHKTSKLNV